MIKIMSGFRTAVKPAKKVLLESNGADTGSICSLLHYYITAYILFAFFLLVSSQQHFGNPINCIIDSNFDETLIPIVNNFCFMSTTFTIIESVSNITGENGVIQHHAYYQWVPLVLLLQAILFLLPHWIWKRCEGGIIGRIVCNLDEDVERRLPALQETATVQLVAKYFYQRQGYHNRLLGQIWLASDMLALLNVLLNFLLTDALLGGKFATYGIEALQFMAKDNILTRTHIPESPNLVFPILTKCSLQSFGPSGSVQLMDSLCLMTLNIVNEKIFCILWWWFLLLVPLTLICILIKLAKITLLKYGSRRYWQSTIGVPTRINEEDLSICTNTMTFGDCVLFNLISKNMRPLTYRVFVKYLAGNIMSQKRQKIN